MASLETYLYMRRQPLWYRLISWPLAGLYGVLWWLGRLVPRARRRLPQPVISIGNLTVGGTGKSPMVMSLCAFLRAHGKRPAILTRGYGTKLSPPGWLALQGRQLICGQGPVPDEAAMQAALLMDVPVIACPDRWRGATAYLAQGREAPDIWIMDDGFQHRQLARDVDVVCVDDRLRLGNDCLLPAGPLREPKGLLKRASSVLLTRSNVTEQAEEAVLGTDAVPTWRVAFRYGEPVPLAAYLGEKASQEVVLPTKWFAICAIAQPERFFDGLRASGHYVVDTLAFADHQPFDRQAVKARIQGIPSSSDVGILITAKDAFREFDWLNQISLPVFVQPLEVVDAEKIWSSLLPSRFFS